VNTAIVLVTFTFTSERALRHRTFTGLFLNQLNENPLNRTK